MIKLYNSLSTKLKVIIGVVMAFILWLVFKKSDKKEPTKSDIKNLNNEQKRAYQMAMAIRSAFGVGVWYQVNADEQKVIDILNGNMDIIVLIENQYFILSKHKLSDDIVKFMNADEIQKIKYNR